MYEKEIIDATKKGNLELIKTYLSKGAAIETQDDAGTLLVTASAKGHLEIVKYLVEKGANINACVNHFTALTVALEFGHREIAKFLVIQHAIKERYIETQDDENLETITNKLITTLLYESKRHGWDSLECMQLKGYIKELKPILYKELNDKEINYIKFISKKETDNNRFYGSYLSDDSDSDEEEKFGNEPPESCKKKLAEAKIYMSRGQINKLTAQNNSKNYNAGDLKNIENGSEVFDLTLRSKIHYSETIDLQTAKNDLSLLNKLIKEGNSLEDAISSVKTTFYVAQFRGITYLTTKWNKPSRLQHRKDSEIHEPQYSATIYKAIKADLFREYAESKKKLNENADKVASLANLLREILLTLREERPYSYRGYTYGNLAYVIQNIYTEDYDLFHKLIKNDPLLKELLFNDASPFFSMGDTPYHPLKYAYGIKPYKGHEDERLRPRWQPSGRAERPYSGSVYVSLHPLADFDRDDGPLHLISLNRTAEIKLQNELVTIPERETCFPAYLPKNRVIYKHITKYPSFKPAYKQIYFYKYGLTKDLYYKFREKLQTARPHTPEMKEFKKLLGEWLCSYHEVKLIDITKKIAEKKGGVLIYQDINGTFSFNPPIDSVNRNTTEMPASIKTPIKQKQTKRASLSPNKDSNIQPLSDEKNVTEIINSMDNLSLEDKNQRPLILTPGNSAISTALSLLINAVRKNRLLALSFFLRKIFFQQALKQKFNIPSADQINLLHFSVLNNNAKATEMLLKVSMDLDQIDKKGNTALHYAVKKENNRLILPLLTKGASIKIKNAKAKTVIDIAIEKGDTKLENWIKFQYQRAKLTPFLQPLQEKIAAQETKIFEQQKAIEEQAKILETHQKVFQLANKYSALFKEKIGDLPEELNQLEENVGKQIPECNQM